MKVAMSRESDAITRNLTKFHTLSSRRESRGIPWRQEIPTKTIEHDTMAHPS